MMDTIITEIPSTGHDILQKTSKDLQISHDIPNQEKIEMYISDRKWQ